MRLGARVRGKYSSVYGVGIDNVVDGQGYSRRGWRRLLPWLRWGAVAFLLSMLLLALAFQPNLPQETHTNSVVLGGDGPPMRRSADPNGGWRLADEREARLLRSQGATARGY